MPCYFPREGWRSRELTKNGKRKIVFSHADAYTDLPVTVPCGQCLGCRLERARQWSVRLMHENQMHELSIFVTLTYNDENLPEGGTLVKTHYQNFMKRLRKFHGSQIRFFHCGEYGEKDRRPHYHAILYGIDFADKKPHSKNAQGDQLYISETLDKIWGKGHCWIGNVSPESCGYVARYILKKVTGEAANAHYENLNVATGEIFSLSPEYVTMSNRPGIGYSWFNQYAEDVFPSDTVITRGKESLPPKYYLRKYGESNTKNEARIKSKRVRNAKKRAANSTPERLSTRLACKQAQISKLQRTL